jgi:hypothetical protein
MDGPFRRLLELHAPNDLVMPVAAPKKAPRFAHAAGQWSWRKLDQHLELQQQQQQQKEEEDAFCVLLHDLCVVDVDDPELARALERDHPELRTTTAREETPRGFHYWFRRSALCDAEGFFDGAAQVRKGVDFKTRCSTGAAVVVVVYHDLFGSNDDDDPFVPIPDDLLRAVAVPRLPPLRRFAFPDGATVEVRASDASLGRFAYFAPFLEEEGLSRDGRPWPVPCEENERVIEGFRALLDGREECAAFSRTIVHLADLLNADRKTSAEAVARALYWQDMDPEMAAAMAAEEADDDSCAPLTEDIRFDGVGGAYASSSRLFDLASPLPRFSKGQVVAGYPHDTCTAIIPPEVDAAMRAHPLVLAGGAALALVTSGNGGSEIGPASDWDLFVYGVDEAGADALLEDAATRFFPVDAGWQRFRTRRAVTFTLEDDAGKRNGLVVQIVLRRYDRASQVPLSFDIAPCKVGAWYPDPEGPLQVWAAPTFVVAMRQLAFPVDLSTWSTASVARALKYCAKGLTLHLPGLRRSYCKKVADIPRGGGVAGLLWAEKVLGRRRPYMGGKMARLIKDLRGADSGYAEDVLKPTSSLLHVLRALFKRGVRALLGGSMSSSSSSKSNNDNANNNSLDLVLWHAPAPPGKSKRGMCATRNPRLTELYGTKYADLARGELFPEI